LGDSTVTVYNIGGGTPTLEINSSLQTTSGATFSAGWVDIASSTVDYFSVADGTWWVQVRDKSNPSNYKILSITLDCIVPGNCTCYEIENPTEGSLTVDYYACDGSQPIIGIPGGSIDWICVISGTTPVADFGLIVTQCPGPVSCTGDTQCFNCGPTPTPTATSTPTPTPTPTPTGGAGTISLQIYGRDEYSPPQSLTFFYNVNGTGAINVPGYILNPFPSSCSLLYTITGLTTSDSVVFGTSINCVMVGAGATSTCPFVSGSSTTYTYVIDAPSTQQVAIAIDSFNIP
jgi:hypothetical protein